MISHELNTYKQTKRQIQLAKKSEGDYRNWRPASWADPDLLARRGQSREQEQGSNHQCLADERTFLLKAGATTGVRGHCHPFLR